MDNLRLILLGIGVVILVAIVLLHKPASKRPSSGGFTRQHREPGLGSAGGSSLEDSEEGGEADANAPDARTRGQQEEPTAPPAQLDSSALANAEQIITVYMRCRAEKGISGRQLCDVADKVGLTFGDMNVFHRRLEGQAQPIFSVANLAQPGTFDAAAWEHFSTPGLTLFAALPGPQSGLATWDAMLAMAERLAELLEGEVLDDGRCLMTRQRIGQMRESMREFDRRHGLSRSTKSD